MVFICKDMALILQSPRVTFPPTASQRAKMTSCAVHKRGAGFSDFGENKIILKKIWGYGQNADFLQYIELHIYPKKREI